MRKEVIDMTSYTNNYVGPRDGCGFLHRHECTGAACDGSRDVPNDGDPFIEADDTRREDEPGDWFVADFDGECSRGGEKFGASVTIRANGEGGWECRECVDEDDFKAEQWDIYVESTEMLGGAA
jgi:hypothetical protein